MTDICGEKGAIGIFQMLSITSCKAILNILIPYSHWNQSVDLGELYPNTWFPLIVARQLQHETRKIVLGFCAPYFTDMTVYVYKFSPYIFTDTFHFVISCFDFVIFVSVISTPVQKVNGWSPIWRPVIWYCWWLVLPYSFIKCRATTPPSTPSNSGFPWKWESRRSSLGVMSATTFGFSSHVTFVLMELLLCWNSWIMISTKKNQ